MSAVLGYCFSSFGYSWICELPGHPQEETKLAFPTPSRHWGFPKVQKLTGRKDTSHCGPTHPQTHWRASHTNVLPLHRKVGLSWDMRSAVKRIHWPSSEKTGFGALRRSFKMSLGNKTPTADQGSQTEPSTGPIRLFCWDLKLSYLTSYHREIQRCK